MATLITDPDLERQVRAQRAEWGGDRHDEVWEGTYMMNPMPKPEHARIQFRLATSIQAVLGSSSLAEVLTELNVSDRLEDWTKNYRCPDIAVMFPGGRARECDAHYLGGPDFVVEIISPNDRSRQKIEFYEQIGVRELLLVDRDPWALELYRLTEGALELVGRSTVGDSAVLSSDVLPVTFQLIAAAPRPQIHLKHRDGVQQWLV
jgi:Uma2 family endonuclease